MLQHWHDRWSLRLKATLAVLLVLVLALAIASIADILQIRLLMDNDERRTVEAVARGVSHAAELPLAVNDERELRRLVNRAMDDEQMHIVAIYNTSGKLIVHSARNPAAWDAYVQGKAEASGLLLGQATVEDPGDQREFSRELEEETPGETVAPPPPGHANPMKNAVGKVVVGLSTAPVQVAQRRQLQFQAVSTSVIALLSIGAVSFLVGAWTRRLNRLVLASERLSQGDFTPVIDERRTDEIGRLSAAYERMREAVRQRDAELRAFAETLQQQVHERTRSLEEALHAAKAADQAKSRFLATMSHEIRTPLNGVVGMIDLLRKTSLDPTQVRYAQIARNSADALLSVINDILDFSKIEAGRMELEAVPFDLSTLLEDLIETASLAAAKKRLELGCVVQPELPAEVVGDPSRLRQVLMNLLNNAIKFTERGHVVIRAILAEPCNGKTVIKFSVTDTGIGIPEDRKAKLFHSFSQVDASTTRKYGGTGLGLAISKRLVEMMGGQIGVDSIPGQGSTFWFTVHLQATGGHKAPPIPAAYYDAMRKLRVIAVDDNSVNREIIQQQLQGWKLQTTVAPDGRTALELMRQAVQRGQPFQLAILDWHMPEMDGIELARAIRASSEFRDMALVMLTSIEDRLESDELRTLGFCGQLVKPVRPSRLFDTISETLQRIACTEVPALNAGSLPLPITPLPESRLRQRHVLMAEDNEINQIVASELLVQAGYSVEVVNNGRAAVDAVFTQAYDLVLMDCQMPEMDGFEAARAIRQREQNMPGAPHIPIIALTANAIKGDREQCLAAGMDEYVAKPVDPPVLFKAMESVLLQRPRNPAATATPASPASPAPVVATPSQAPPADIPTLDCPSLLKRCLGKTELAMKVLDLFQNQVVTQFETLEQSLAEGNAQALTRTAHAIKGAAAYTSAEGVRQAAFALERLARDGNLTTAERQVQHLKSEIDRCLASLPHARTTLESATETGQPR